MAYGYLEISIKPNHLRLIVLIKMVVGKFDFGVVFSNKIIANSLGKQRAAWRRTILGMGFSESFSKGKNIFLSKVGERCCKLE